MSKKLYVTSLPYTITKEEFENIFNAIGTVVSSKLIMNTKTDQSKGFGFIEMSTEEEGEQAINQLNGTSFGDRTISVSVARSENKVSDDRYGQESDTDSESED